MSDPNDSATLPELLAVMVHDLNNPVAALGTNLAFLENLLKSSASPDVVETLSDMRMLCDIMRRLIRNVSTLGQPNPPSIQAVSMDPVALAMGSIERLAPQADASEVKLKLDAVCRTGQVFVEKDPELCERALDNLLAFAIERAVVRSKIVVSVAPTNPLRVSISCSVRPQSLDTSPQPSRSRQLQSTFGRGLSLYCAQIAANAAKSRVTVERNEQNVMTLELVLNHDDKQNA